ncbi:Nn.00g083930.m01.CDS01 [Neocucurbitaria sp. VM-36]
MGCKSGHQSACCSTNTQSVAAYNNCRWEGCTTFSGPNYSYCSAAYPNLAVVSINGFGGQAACPSGISRGYCCKGDSINFTPPAFSECIWMRDIRSPLADALSCNAACPPDYTKIALRQAKCNVGEDAYCCKGYKPSEIPDIQNPSGKPEAPKKSPKVQEFESAVASYIEAYDSRQCPPKYKAKLAPWLEEDAADDVHASESAIPGNDAGITPALPPCLQWMLIASELAVIVKRSAQEWSRDQKLMVKYWDSLIPSRWPGTSVADLGTFLHDNPISTPDDVVKTVLHGFDEWVGIRNAFQTMKTKICLGLDVAGTEVQQSDSDTQEISGPDPPPITVSSIIKSRSISLDLTALAGDYRDILLGKSKTYMPWLGRILHGIRIERLSLHYARWMWYRGNDERGISPGPILELAYWIGPVPGGWSEELEDQLELWRYRDLRQYGERNNQHLRDRWVVFHLHFDSTRDIFSNSPSGHTYTGYTALSFFHANTAVLDRDGHGWHVDNNDSGPGGNNQRSVLHCPWDDLDRTRQGTIITRMWVGAFDDPFSSTNQNRPSTEADELHAFHNRLYRQGYLRRAGMLPIIQDRYRDLQSNPYGELPAHHYEVIRPGAQAIPRPPGDDLWVRPYETNFRLPDHLDHGLVSFRIPYEYDIDMPARLPQEYYERPWETTVVWPHHGTAQTSEDIILGKVGYGNETNGTMDAMS